MNNIIAEINKNYNENFIDINLIQEGCDNNTYLLKTQNGNKFIKTRKEKNKIFYVPKI